MFLLQPPLSFQKWPELSWATNPSRVHWPLRQGWGPSAHIPYLIASPKHKVVAVCNISVASAEAAIKQNKLSPETKACRNTQGGPPSTLIGFNQVTDSSRSR